MRSKFVALTNAVIVDVFYFTNYFTHAYIASIPDKNY